MTDANTTTNTPEPTKQAKGKPQPLSTVVHRYAVSKKINDTDAGKRVRAFIRGNRSDLEKVWPALKTHSKGDRYGDVPVSVQKMILTGKRSK